VDDMLRDYAERARAGSAAGRAAPPGKSAP
jgi:hypothetical protein